MEAVTIGHRCASHEGMPFISERDNLLLETRQVIESRGSFMDRTDLLDLIERLHQVIEAEDARDRESLNEMPSNQFAAMMPFASH
jgi:hypothetical protein